MAITKQPESKRAGIGPITAGVVGAAAAVTAVVLTHKETREKIGKVLKDAVERGAELKKVAIKRMDETKRHAKKIEKEAKQTLSELKDTSEESLASHINQ